MQKKVFSFDIIYSDDSNSLIIKSNDYTLSCTKSEFINKFSELNPTFSKELCKKYLDSIYSKLEHIYDPVDRNMFFEDNINDLNCILDYIH